jgi:hypothetical protein
MPYVVEDLRNEVDREIKELLVKLSRVQDSKLDGVVNYTVTRIIDALYGGGGYSVYNRAMGVLSCIKDEFYRRRVAPYEDEKIKENGDVYN